MTRLLALLTFLLALASPRGRDPSASAKLYALRGGRPPGRHQGHPRLRLLLLRRRRGRRRGGCRRITLSGVEGAVGEVWFPEAHVKPSEYEGLGPSLIFEGRRCSTPWRRRATSILGARRRDRRQQPLSCVLGGDGAPQGHRLVWEASPPPPRQRPEAPAGRRRSSRRTRRCGDAPEADRAPIFAENEVAKAPVGRADEDDVAGVVEVATPRAGTCTAARTRRTGSGIATPTVITVEGGAEWEEVHYPRPEHYVPKVLRRGRLDPRGHLPLR